MRACLFNHLHRQRTTRIEVPHFIRWQPMKGREILGIEQKINRRRRQPCPAKSSGQRFARDHHVRTIRLPEVSALRMRLQLQLLNPMFGVIVFHAHSWPQTPYRISGPEQVSSFPFKTCETFLPFRALSDWRLHSCLSVPSILLMNSTLLGSSLSGLPSTEAIQPPK